MMITMMFDIDRNISTQEEMVDSNNNNDKMINLNQNNEQDDNEIIDVESDIEMKPTISNVNNQMRLNFGMESILGRGTNGFNVDQMKTVPVQHQHQQQQGFGLASMNIGLHPSSAAASTNGPMSAFYNAFYSTFNNQAPSMINQSVANRTPHSNIWPPLYDNSTLGFNSIPNQRLPNRNIFNGKYNDKKTDIN